MDKKGTTHVGGWTMNHRLASWFRIDECLYLRVRYLLTKLAWMDPQASGGGAESAHRSR